MLTDEQIQRLCKAIKDRVSRETGIKRSWVDQLMDRFGEYQPTDLT